MFFVQPKEGPYTAPEMPSIAGLVAILLFTSFSSSFGAVVHGGRMVDVFFPGLQPQLCKEGMESCYRIPSLLYIPGPEVGGRQGTLLAVVESKHGHKCGDGVNSTLLMRRSTDGGRSWSQPSFPFRRWENLRKWGQPQMAYDSTNRAALLLFSNETLSQSPGGVQSLDSVLQIRSTDVGLTWSSPTRVDERSPRNPGGATPSSGNGIQLRSGMPRSGRLLFSMDTVHVGPTADYAGDHVLLSDDFGRSYDKSYSLDRPHMDEMQLAQLGNGSIFAVM